jgi:hypothetical protein
MKKLVFVLGDCAPESKLLTDKFTSFVNEQQGTIFHTAVLGSHETLKIVLEKIRSNDGAGGADYKKMLVVYAGRNTDLISENMPCDNLDLFLLSGHLISVAGGYETPQQKDIVDTLLFGGIKALLKE